MKIETNEIYERYYAAVAGRFYTAGEKRRLLSLFARGLGIAEGSGELLELQRTLEQTDRLAIESLVDCNNFLLIADSIPGRREVVKAVRAQKGYFEKARSAGAPVYYSLLEWRTQTFSLRNESPEAKLEAAYIDYARGSVDTAIRYFEDVAERTASLLAVEHLAIIYLERQDMDLALEKLLILNRVMETVIGMDSGEYVRRLIAEARAQIGEEEYVLAAKRADDAIRRSFSYGAVARNAIGFRR